MSGQADDWLADVDDASEELVARELDIEGNEVDRDELVTIILEELVGGEIVAEGNELVRVELLISILGSGECRC